MSILRLAFMSCLLIVSSNSEEVHKSEVVPSGKKEDASPTSVDSRFFDLGGIINQLFPGFNQDGSRHDPPGMDYPVNSQFYPAVSIQPPLTTGLGNNWPVIDDAKQYPNQAHLSTQPQYPSGNFGGLPQTQYPNGNLGGAPQIPNAQYPNQETFGGPYPSQRPQTPIFGGQVPNQSGFGQQPIQNAQFPNQASFGNSQYPNWQGFQTNQSPRDPNQGNILGSQPNLNSQYPDQGNFGGSPANSFPQFPNQINNGNPTQNQFPNQGGFNQNQNIGEGPSGGDGTIDSLIPPQGSWNSGRQVPIGPSNPELPINQTPDPVDQPIEPEERPAILGNPVIVPPPTTEQPGRINYPTSTESPAKKQCVQDCETTSEYNPVCGSDNVTYINPGKFVCARNCGINVFVMRRGRCPNDTPFPRNVLAVNS